MVSTQLKNISQNGNLPQIGVQIKNVWNHHQVYIISPGRGEKKPLKLNHHLVTSAGQFCDRDLFGVQRLIDLQRLGDKTVTAAESPGADGSGFGGRGLFCVFFSFGLARKNILQIILEWRKCPKKLKWPQERMVGIRKLTDFKLDWYFEL